MFSVRSTFYGIVMKSFPEYCTMALQECDTLWSDLCGELNAPLLLS